MEKEFTPYELALALKELGFDEECLSAFFDDKIKRCDYVQNSKSNYLSAPLYQQAFRWFREKYGLMSEIVWTSALPTHNTFTAIIKSEEKIAKMTECDTYEEAELECLRKLIQIVKEQK